MILSSRSSFPIWLLNEKGAVIAANPDAFQMLKYSETELYSLNFFSDIVSTDSRLKKNILSLHNKKTVEDFLEFKTNDSICVTRKCSMAQVKNNIGQKIYIIQGIKEEFLVKDAEKTFFNVIFHNMLGLLQKIISNLESISSLEVSPEYANQLERTILMIDNYAHTMKEIAFIPFDGGVNILTSLEKIALKYEIHPSKKITISIKHDEKITIKTHPLFMKAIGIILDNAIEYTKDKNVEIDILLKKQLYNLNIEIIDKGIGIPPEYRESVFKKYFKVPGSGKGTGLGLFLVKKIIEIFNGSIKISDRIEGQPSQGTKIIVKLPYPVLPPKNEI